jgi:hypothetical protein
VGGLSRNMRFSLGIVSFLVNWLALSHNPLYQLPLPHIRQAPIHTHTRPHTHPHGLPHTDTDEKSQNVQSVGSQWSLLADIYGFSVHTLECMLPQVCALLIERDSSEQTNTHNDGYNSAEYVADNIRFRNAEIFDYMETMLVDKCALCLPFGMKMFNYLQVRAALLCVFLCLLACVLW